jgi:hypothetical protein
VLPDALRRRVVTGAALRGGRLSVAFADPSTGQDAGEEQVAGASAAARAVT